MRKRSFLNVRLPIVNKTYGIWAPHDMTVLEVLRLTQKMMQEHVPRKYKLAQSASLYKADDGEALDVNKYIGEFKFPSGARLILG